MPSVGVWAEKKPMPRWFSPSQTLLPNLASCLGRWKSAWHKFSRRHPPTGGMLPVCIPKSPTLCKIRNTGNLAPIFRRQPSFYMCKQAACRLWVGEVKKIDAKPIFTVPDMMSIDNNVWDGENQRGIVFFLSNNNKWHSALLQTMIADRPCNFGGKLSPELCFLGKTLCVNTRTS